MALGFREARLLSTRFAAATTALLVGVCLVSPVKDARAQGAACDEASDIAVLPSPVSPWKGAPLRVLVASERAADGELSLTGPDGQVAARSRDRQGGPPYFWVAEVKAPAVGNWRATLQRSGCGPVTRDIAVRADKPAGPGGAAGSVWPIRAAWTRETENLFSAWIEKLFDAPLDVELSWPALHVGLRDPSRNFLFNHLSLGEDQMNMVLRPDCADLPYFLRAYFAFKIGLPYGMSKCSRGGGGRGPTCPAWTSIQNSNEAAAPAADTDRRCAGRRAAEAAARAGGRVRRVHEAGGRYRPFGLRTHGARRQQHGLLPGVAVAADAAAGHGLCRSLRPHPDDREARAADRELGGRHPRGRRPA